MGDPREIFDPNPYDRAAERRSGKDKPPRKRFCDCPMGAAVRSVKRRRFRLARRYAVMSARLIAARIA